MPPVRGPHWKYFLDNVYHPNTGNFGPPGGDEKLRTYCLRCFDSDVRDEQARDSERLRIGEITLARTIDEIKLVLFTRPGSKRWTNTRAETMRNHLKNCSLQPLEIRDLASRHFAEPTGSYHGGSSIAFPPSSSVGMPSGSIAAMDEDALTQFGGGLGLVPMQPISYSQVPRSPGPPSVATSHGGSFVVEPGDSVSQVGAAASPTVNPTDFPSLKRIRTNSRPGSGIVVLAEPSQQAAFERSLIRLVSSADLSFNFMENPEVQEFFRTYLPQYRLPSRKTLSGRILTTTLDAIRKESRSTTRDLKVTLQCDGWTGSNHQHLIAFMMTGNQKLYTLQVINTTTERKTADLLLEHMKAVIKFVQEHWKAIVIAFTTDASGEARKARKLLLREFPHLVVPDCYAHQINLIVGDYFKAHATFQSSAAQANALISWLRSKSQVLGIIRQRSLLQGLGPLSVIRPVATRWTGFYTAYSRLVKLQTTLEWMIVDDASKHPTQRMVVQGDRKAKETAEKMVALIKDSNFWAQIKRITLHLEPLALAANLMQLAYSRLDEVTTVFGDLYRVFSSFQSTHDTLIRKAVLSSIDKRWRASERELFIAAVLLNPIVMKITGDPFAPRSMFVRARKVELFEKLYKRFFARNPPNGQIYNNLCDWEEEKGEYTLIKKQSVNVKARADAANLNSDPASVYKDLMMTGRSGPPLTELALHIFAICPNSASCERLFSSFGQILTDQRSRLTPSRLTDLAELKMHVRDESVRQDIRGKLAQRSKRLLPSHQPSPAGTPPSGTPVESRSGSPIVASSATLPTESYPLNDPELTASLPNPQDQELEAITSNLTRQAEDDDTPAVEPDADPMALSRIFDFSAPFWGQYEKRYAISSLSKELEILDLLMEDAPVEEFATFDLDPLISELMTT